MPNIPQDSYYIIKKYKILGKFLNKKPKPPAVSNLKLREPTI